jgi:hypothetical protein
VKLRRISQTIRSHRWFGKKKREIIFRFTSLLIQLGILFRFNSRGSSRLSPCAWVLTYVPPSHSLRQTSRRQRKKKKGTDDLEIRQGGTFHEIILFCQIWNLFFILFFFHYGINPLTSLDFVCVWKAQQMYMSTRHYTSVTLASLFTFYSQNGGGKKIEL